ncbi:hypothetical protein ACFWAR_00220 [Streptomyces sp. NPDC059917]|uniref:hypothetical protein n=1 Tax=Streptomyces sp. NPDC059917 TaxID=3347002 RepID=UPI00364B9881
MSDLEQRLHGSAHDITNWQMTTPTENRRVEEDRTLTLRRLGSGHKVRPTLHAESRACEDSAGEFRRTAALVPLDTSGSLWTADQDGVRWICAFSDEETPGAFARAQGDADRDAVAVGLAGSR